MVQVNIVALTRLTRLFLPGMVQRNEGRIMNVASTAAFQAGPLMAVYYASKAYVLHFSEALDAELRKTKVRVTRLLPGSDRHRVRGSRRGSARRDCSPAASVMSAAAARIGYRGLMRSRRIVVPGLWNKLLVLSVRLFPRRLDHAQSSSGCSGGRAS